MTSSQTLRIKAIDSIFRTFEKYTQDMSKILKQEDKKNFSI